MGAGVAMAVRGRPWSSSCSWRGRSGRGAEWRAAGALGRAWRLHKGALPTDALKALEKALLATRASLMPWLAPESSEGEQLLDILALLAGAGGMPRRSPSRSGVPTSQEGEGTTPLTASGAAAGADDGVEAKDVEEASPCTPSARGVAACSATPPPKERPPAVWNAQAAVFVPRALCTARAEQALKEAVDRAAAEAEAAAAAEGAAEVAPTVSAEECTAEQACEEALTVGASPPAAGGEREAVEAIDDAHLQKPTAEPTWETKHRMAAEARRVRREEGQRSFVTVNDLALCPAGHTMKQQIAARDDEYDCDMCVFDIVQRQRFLGCTRCDYVLCGSCVANALFEVYPWHLGSCNHDVDTVVVRAVLQGKVLEGARLGSAAPSQGSGAAD